MATIRQKELEFLRKLKRRFTGTDYTTYKNVITDMAKEGLISAASVNEALANTPVNNLLSVVKTKTTKKRNRAVKREEPKSDPCTRPIPYSSNNCGG